MSPLKKAFHCCDFQHCSVFSLSCQLHHYSSLKYLGIILEYSLVCEGSPGDPVVDRRQNMSFDSRGSPADVSTDIPLICHTSGSVLHLEPSESSKASGCILIVSNTDAFSPLGHHLLFDPDGRTEKSYIWFLTFLHITSVWGGALVVLRSQ